MRIFSSTQHASPALRGARRTPLALLAAGALLVGGVVAAPTPASAYRTAYDIVVRTHVQNIGWSDGPGTIGRSLRLEAVQLFQAGRQVICGQAHVAGIGWQTRRCTSATNRSIVLGTVGQGRAIEAVRIGAPGRMMRLDAHVQNVGNLQVMSARSRDAFIGTVGRGLRMEQLIVSPH